MAGKVSKGCDVNSPDCQQKRQRKRNSKSCSDKEMDNVQVNIYLDNHHFLPFISSPQMDGTQNPLKIVIPLRW